MNTNEEIISPAQLNDSDELSDWSTWPAWLDEKLQMAAAFTAFTRADAPVVTPEFHTRCQQTAWAAHAQAKLRAEQERRGENFIPLGLSDYLWELAQSAQVVLAPVLAQLGLTELGQLQIGTARALGQLACSAGLSLLETLTHLRLGFARQYGLQDDLQALLAHRRSQRFKRNLLKDYAAALTQLEKSLAPARWQELQQLEHEIRAVYEESKD